MSAPSLSNNTKEAFEVDTLRYLKSGDCCSYIEFGSTYPSLQIPPTDANYITTIELFKEDCCGRRTCIELRADVPGTTTQIFGNLLGDGNYVVVVSFYDAIADEIYTVELCEKLSCCDKKRSDLACSVKTKMANIACTICSRKSIGRNTKRLEKDYLILSNFLWLLSSCSCAGKIPLTCKEVEMIKCKFKKIK